MIRGPPRSRLFPCTTLFRSRVGPQDRRRDLLRVRGLPGGDAAVGHTETAPGPLPGMRGGGLAAAGGADRKSTRLNSSHANTWHAAFCLKKEEVVAGG